MRFGKLQVLRAGEKRVTLRMPNNLPAPHIAPFSMKVGETGEAFFVLETEEEVPADLLTSPVVGAADVSGPSCHGKHQAPHLAPLDARADELAHTQADNIPPQDEDFPIEEQPSAEHSLTQQPFGATERQVSHKDHADTSSIHLPDVEPLDLNEVDTSAADDKTSKPAAPATPSSVLDSGKPRQSVEKARRASDVSRPRASTDSRPPGAKTPPPNPLEAAPGDDTELPTRDWNLKFAPRGADGVDLPKVPKGKHDGPEVKYGKDIVLDASGFHATDKDITGKVPNQDKKGGGPQSMSVPHSTPASPSMYPRPDPPKGSSTIEDENVEQLVNDLMASVTLQTKKDDLQASMAALALEGEKPKPSTPSPQKVRGYDRAQTEPPEENGESRPVSPTGERMDNSAQMDLAWDWSQLPKDKEDAPAAGSHPLEDGATRRAPNRGESLPVALDGVVQHTPRATIAHVDDDPFTFMLQLDNNVHLFELSLCGHEGYAPEGKASATEREEFNAHRITFSKFMQDSTIVDDPNLIVRYKGLYLSWMTGYHLLFALAIYRRSFTPAKSQPAQPQRQSGYWSRWWRRGGEPTGAAPLERVQSASGAEPSKTEKQLSLPPVPATSPSSETPSPAPTPALDSAARTSSPLAAAAPAEEKHYAKTLRLSSDQLKELNLKPGPNTIQFSVTSSYSGNAVVSARIFLWEDTDQVIISDIDGTITKSDALGHVFAAIGRDWTHVGIANLYTDITNNGYKIIYLTARAIGQADTTREYLKTIVQGDYRMPEGPVIMSPDRLMASLHREVILRKPELFKMACLRDIQRLFAKNAKTAFFAGFGNRITDAMSYRSVGIETGKIYTIDSNGVILTELLQTSHRGSYVALNDLVNEVFPPVKTKFQPQYTDFNYWKAPIADIPLPDFTMPPSPALSARSDTSGASRLSVLGRIATLGRRGSRSPPPEGASPSQTRPSSPLLLPSITAGDLSDEEDDGWGETHEMTAARARRDSGSSMPGSFDNGNAFPEEWLEREGSGDERVLEGEDGKRRLVRTPEGDLDTYEDDDDDAMFDDDILATGEMANVPF